MRESGGGFSSLGRTVLYCRGGAAAHRRGPGTGSRKPGFVTLAFLLLKSLRWLVGEDLAVADVNNAMGKFGDVRLVRHQNDGVAAGME